MDNIIRLIPGDDAVPQGDADAIEIGALYTKARRGPIDNLRYLIEAGQRLAAKKNSLPHGEWLPWLRNNADILGFEHHSTAARLLQMGKFRVDAEYDESEALELLRQFWGNETEATRNIKPYSRGDDEWYTPATYVTLVRRVLGGIDLDPASNKNAQKVVKAKRYFTKDDDALDQEWHGRVWLNPPYSKGNLIQFVDKMVEEVETGHVTAGIMLLNNFTDADWFHRACSVSAAVCFPHGRIYFENASGKIDRPLNGQVFFYYGTNVDSFSTEFASVGSGFVGAWNWSSAQ